MDSFKFTGPVGHTSAPPSFPELRPSPTPSGLRRRAVPCAGRSLPRARSGSAAPCRLAAAAMNPAACPVSITQGWRRVEPLTILETEIPFSQTTNPSVLEGISAPNGMLKEGTRGKSISGAFFSGA